MINKTTIKIPQKYQGYIESVEKETQRNGEYMYWAYAKDGYYFTDTETHSASGYTQAELLQDVRTVAICSCGECSDYRKSVIGDKLN